MTASFRAHSRQVDGTLTRNKSPSTYAVYLGEGAATTPDRPVGGRFSGAGVEPRRAAASRVAASVVGAGAIRPSRAWIWANACVARTGLRTSSSCASRVMYSDRAPGFG